MMNVGFTNIKQGESFNLQRCVFVIGIFGIITIISYFNELAKAGLLFRTNKFSGYRQIRSSDISHIIHKNGHLEHINLDLANVRKVLDTEHKNPNSKSEGKINIALSLGKNDSYSSTNGTKIKIYNHKNTMPNFFVSLENYLSVPPNNDTLQNISGKLLDEYRKKQMQYKNATRVLLYQHEWGGYATRDCVKSLADADHLTKIDSPLNQYYRQEWESLPVKKKDKYQVLFGGVSFGVCEGVSRPCNYFAMISHPVDRVLQVFYQCKHDSSHAFCHFDKLNVSSMDLPRFIRSQGSGFFKKLLYYSRHCKLVGDDELCLQDPKSAFIFSSKERQIYLQNILENLSSWFSVIGLVERFAESMALFEHVFGQNFTGCNVSKHYLPHYLLKGTPSSLVADDIDQGLDGKLIKEYLDLREKLLNNTEVLRYIHADLAIYNKLEEIFEEQLKVYSSILTVNNDMKSKVPTTIEKNKMTKNLKNGTEISLVKHIPSEFVTKMFSRNKLMMNNNSINHEKRFHQQVMKEKQWKIRNDTKQTPIISSKKIMTTKKVYSIQEKRKNMFKKRHSKSAREKQKL